MARMNDSSTDCRRWTNAKLMREARRYANLEDFSSGFYEGENVTFKHGWSDQTGSARVDDFCRRETRIYRDTWLKPILDEIERRFVHSGSN